jgi:hypothetical protein
MAGNRTGAFNHILFDRENPALRNGSEFKGFALKDMPNPVMPIFSRPYLFRKVAATQYLGFDEYGKDS